jgi:hypothetical protein
LFIFSSLFSSFAARFKSGFQRILDAPHRNIVKIQTIRFACFQRFNAQVFFGNQA